MGTTKQSDLVKSALVEVKQLIADPKSKNAVLASAVAYALSKDNKERNAFIAGLAAYLLTQDEE